jgi:hypothetical protein
VRKSAARSASAADTALFPLVFFLQLLNILPASPNNNLMVFDGLVRWKFGRERMEAET